MEFLPLKILKSIFMHTMLNRKLLHKMPLLILLLLSCFSHAQFNNNFSFDGATQAVALPKRVLNGASVFTIEFRVKTTESRSSTTYWQNPTLAGVALNGFGGDFGIITSNGYIGLWSGLNGSSDNSFISSTVQVNDNNWHHIAAVNDGTNITLFADGVNVGSITSGTGLGTSNVPLTLGARSLDFNYTGNIGINNFFHQGLLDEIRISSNARYTGNFPIPTSPFATDVNTLALYHLDAGCTNSLVPDASANANNAKPYGFTGSCAFTLPPVPAIAGNTAISNISKAEYFFDTDPGFGNGQSIVVTPGTDVTVTPSVDIHSLSAGAHRLFIRSRNAAGRWGHTNMGTFFIVPLSPSVNGNKALANIDKAEYFFDTDPGFGNGTTIAVTAGTDVQTSYAVDISKLKDGTHQLYLRTRNTNGSWSLTNRGSFYIVPVGPVLGANKIPGNIVQAEYFLDTDPGFGNGTAIPVTPGADISAADAVIDISKLSDGAHRVFIRTKDNTGNWGHTNAKVFSIVAANVTIPANRTPGNITAFEYFFDTDPGFGNGHMVTVPASTDLVNYSFVADISALKDSVHVLYIRTFDDWSLTNSRSFIKGNPLPVTWLTFTGQLNNAEVLLNWQTATEKNNSYYVIERSADNRQYQSIGEEKAGSSGSSVHDYGFTDTKPLSGVSYYRIKQVDADGKFSYSSVIAIRLNTNGNAVQVYPNPARDMVTIAFKEIQTADTELRLLSMGGQLLQSVQAKGTNIQQLNVTGLANGIYQLQILSGKLTTTKKIVVQH